MVNNNNHIPTFEEFMKERDKQRQTVIPVKMRLKQWNSLLDTKESIFSAPNVKFH